MVRYPFAALFAALVMFSGGRMSAADLPVAPAPREAVPHEVTARAKAAFAFAVVRAEKTRAVSVKVRPADMDAARKAFDDAARMLAASKLPTAKKD